MTQNEKSSYARAWEVHDYAEKILADRMNYGMVAQSMLMLSFVTLLSNSNQSNFTPIAEILICLFGTFYSYFQLSRIRSVSQRIIHLQKKYLMDDEVFSEYMTAYSPSTFSKRIRTHYVPVTLYGLWLTFLILSAVQYILK